MGLAAITAALNQQAAERHEENLRDSFAAAALQGLVPPLPSGGDYWQMQEVARVMARCAYIVADAMMEARKVPR